MAESGSRRPLTIAQVLLAVAAAALWVASRLPWVSIRSFDELGPPTTTTLSGAEWSTVLLPAALVLLAAVVAALAVRGWPLRVLALLVAALSLALGYLAIGQWAASDVAARAAHLAQIPVQSLTAGTERHLLGAGITMVAAVCALVAAVLLMRSGAGRGAATKYATPAARRESAQDDDAEAGPMSERLIWDALDEGRDPTDTEGR
ncbi:TIGR02234 family membrane protein [Mycobacterium sp. 1274756.6]|uniref:TIGR02234 family membrane protein n=1 Tax=Mycobacterium sp. 1274756.6 TaxID=1834076 RepID=UPI0007FD82F0|nr:TIGR02234 family membrane protein [Mycobacterium sp. 1274756.6]OBJ71643.1 hypothetical protein A5643_07135 [Mycobacterium sp. 1274756.6]